MKGRFHLTGEGASRLEIDLENFSPISPERVMQALEEEVRTQIIEEMVGIALYHRAQILAEEIEPLIKPTQDEIASLREEVPERAAEVAQAQAELAQVRQELYRELYEGETAQPAAVKRLEVVEKESRSRVVNGKTNQRSAEIQYRDALDKLESIRCLVNSLREVPKPETETLDLVLDALR